MNFGGVVRRALWAGLLLMLVSGPAAGGRPEAERGQKLVGELGCPVCHEIRGHATTATQEAPDLSREGEKVRPEWLFDFLRKPHTLRPWLKARMPSFRLEEREALALTAFIATRREPQAVAVRASGKGAPSQARLAEGKKLFDLFECAECHPAGGQKTDKGKRTDLDEKSLAPDLALAGGRLQPEWVLRWLRSPQALQPGTKMPNYFYEENGKDALMDEPEEKIHLLRDYLFSLGSGGSASGFAEAKERFPGVGAPEGEALFRELNCAGCHKVSGLGAGEKVGPVLDREGSRVQKVWLEEFLTSPKPLRLTLVQRMPDFRLTAAETGALAAYLGTLVEGKVPGDLFPGGNPSGDLVRKGELLLNEELGCLACHRIGKNGAFGGPVLTQAGRRLKAGWIYRWLQNPKHFQPKTPMPRVELTEEEARAITAYLSSLR